MVAVVGTYQNGYVKLDKEYASNTPLRVIVTFLDDVQAELETVLSLSDFSFAKSQENLDHVKTSLSDEVIDERRES